MDDLRWAKMCPRFETCSTSRCPLDPVMAERNTDRRDREQRCRARLRDRVVIGIQATADGVKLPHGGLTGREAACGMSPRELLAVRLAKLEKRRAQRRRTA